MSLFCSLTEVSLKRVLERCQQVCVCGGPAHGVCSLVCLLWGCPAPLWGGYNRVKVPEWRPVPYLIWSPHCSSKGPCRAPSGRPVWLVEVWDPEETRCLVGEVGSRGGNESGDDLPTLAYVPHSLIVTLWWQLDWGATLLSILGLHVLTQLLQVKVLDNLGLILSQKRTAEGHCAWLLEVRYSDWLCVCEFRSV